MFAGPPGARRSAILDLVREQLALACSHAKRSGHGNLKAAKEQGQSTVLLFLLLFPLPTMNVRRSLRIPLAVAILFFTTAVSAAPPPARLLTASFSGGCDTYTIAVTGEGLNQPNPVVSYNITLTPRSGEPMTITDSFVITAEKDGSFRKTVHQAWKKFEYTLTGKYTLSGIAVLLSDRTPLHTLPLTFSPAKLNCATRR